MTEAIIAGVPRSLVVATLSVGVEAFRWFHLSVGGETDPIDKVNLWVFCEHHRPQSLGPHHSAVAVQWHLVYLLQLEHHNQVPRTTLRGQSGNLVT